MIEQYDKNQEFIGKYRGRRVIGALCVMVAMTGCADGESQPPATPSVEFNQPDTGEYFLDSPDQYYSNLQSTLELADSDSARANINQLLETPISQWLNTTTESTIRAITENLQQSEIESTIPVFVAYNIPNRDLGGEARGGLNNADEYRDWIDAISQTIDDASSVIILEPDALGGLPKITDQAQQDERISLLRGALEQFKQNNKNTAVYLDIGHSRWLDPRTATDLIQRIDQGDGLVGGISLNVSNQRSGDETRAYADTISDLMGRDLYVMIDVSMNGAQNTDELLEWCNVDGEHIGTLEDTTYDADQRVEEMYIKAPGESDGRCGESTKIAGEFDPQLLIKQVS